MVQFHPGSLDEDWSVGVSAARVRGKDEGRVQFPDGPLTNKWAGWSNGTTAWLATRRSGFDSPTGPLNKWAHGPTGRRQLGRLEIRVRFPVGPLITEGSRIRLAGPVC